MCGRLNIIDSPSFTQFFESIGIHFDSKLDAPRYNIAPSSYIPAILSTDDKLDVAQMKWGLLPHWAKPETFSRPLINARAETIAEKPSFKHLFANSRAVIPVSGFYEWQRRKDTKRTFHFQPHNDNLFLMAGVWQISKQGEPQCCIATTAANDVMKPVHHRMPVLLDTNTVDDWMKGGVDVANDLLKPAPDDWLSATEVSSYVNNARNEGAQCIAPLH